MIESYKMKIKAFKNISKTSSLLLFVEIPVYYSSNTDSLVPLSQLMAVFNANLFGPFDLDTR